MPGSCPSQFLLLKRRGPVWPREVVGRDDMIENKSALPRRHVLQRCHSHRRSCLLATLDLHCATKKALDLVSELP